MSQIIKSKISNGVFWLEFPNADLRILCGCPADAVKHMMKRGIILQNEASPVFRESGPNAILLSDLSVQKGCFSNLGEFPVLQMLYRQGMILPDHPGNTGVKPLLIGHADQVDAQIQYIYRGNYGLVCDEELIETGTSPEQANQLMRLKRKFAFGHIADPNDLLDSCILDNGKREIRNGVFAERLAVNLFEFTYQGESVQVDLNLGNGESYQPSYNLGHFQVEREYFSVIHSGEGDGWDTERPSMASVLTFQGRIYLIDVGPNIETTLKALGIDISEVEGIFMTHCHDDHFAGLPTLIRSDHRIKFFATPLVRAATVKKLSALMAQDESRFTQFFDVHELENDIWQNIEGLEVKPVISPHPMETTVMFFRTQWEDGYKTYGHLADIASFDVLDTMVTQSPTEDGITAEFAAEIKNKYLEPCNLKKVDNGGGMIHGMAKDFIDDTSDKIIFAHSAHHLNESERQIGSGAPFGTQDILIPSNHDFLFTRAYSFLSDFFPQLPQDQFRLLLNHEVVTFNPEEIILKAGENIHHSYFILTGTAETLDPETGHTHRMSAGSFIGDMDGLCESKATETYRSVSFIQALKLPIAMYLEFVKRNDIFEQIVMLTEKRDLLGKSWLFGGAISDGIKNSIAASMHITHDFSSFDDFTMMKNYIALIKEGTVTLKVGETVFETLGAGECLFEDHAVYGLETIYNYEYSDHCAIALIPITSIKSIPIVQWKLLEHASRQMRNLADTKNWDNSILNWRRQYALGIGSVDREHKKLLELSERLINAIMLNTSEKDIHKYMDQFHKAAVAHFANEEKYLHETNYANTPHHMEKHAKLIEQLAEIKEQVHQNKESERTSLCDFLRRWALAHILLEDRKFASLIH